MKRALTSIAMACAMVFIWASDASASQPYVGVGLGLYNINTGLNKKSTFGEYLQVGDDFSQYLGGEFRIGTSNKTSGATAAAPAAKMDWMAAFYLKPRYEFSSDLTAYGLVGLGTIRASFYPAGAVKQTKTRSGLGYGLGLQYRTSDQFSLAAEWSHLLTKPKNATATRFNGISASMFTISGKYHFW
ncbi:MAG TPA: porin family protein [Mariprofundaceae bacterium]|nr:porin family protein [Mariprofundaceae bacterium]